MMKAKLWAEEHQTYVFKWRCKVGKQENRPLMSEMDKIIQYNAFFWQYFVAGAPAHLSYNINGELALVNGAPVTLHSITFDDDEELQRI